MNFSPPVWFYIFSSFLAGFAVMTVELIASRIVAPIIGASVFTWTSVIGTTLLGLALGNFLGGKLADKKNPEFFLPLSFLISSVFTSLIPTLSGKVSFLINSSDSILGLNLFLALYLFLLPTLAIGLIQPLILKIYTNDFSKMGSRYGSLSLSWSLGGILGVFLTGFYFVSFIGSKETIWLMALTLFLTGLVFALTKRGLLLVFILTFLFLFLFFLIFLNKNYNQNIIYQKETNYYLARVIDTVMPNEGRAKILALDFDFHSVEAEQNPHDYPEIYPVFKYLNLNISEILNIGSGAYTISKNFAKEYPLAEINVIEIDPEIEKISENYFDLKDYKINTIVGDAKIILNKNSKKYDLIFGDAYNSFISVPWYLLTREWNEQIKDKLTENGIYALNFAGSFTEGKNEFSNSVITTFQKSFPNSYIFTFGDSGVRNIVLIGLRGEKRIDEKDLEKKLLDDDKKFLAGRVLTQNNLNLSPNIVLTDNFAPVEKLMMPVVKSYFPKNLFLMNYILNSEQPKI